MTQLVAKPIVKDQFWVIKDGDRKVGNVLANNNGYELILNGNHAQFENTHDIKEKVKIRFEPLKSNKTKVGMPYPQYPITGKTHNSVFDVKRKLHLFTKTKKSKCYYAAGWYVIDLNGVTQTQLCPKYIFIQRYPYVGPFKTQEEANMHINRL